MALFRSSLKTRIAQEDANPRAIEVEASAQRATVDQLKKETDESLAVVASVEREGELLTEEMEVLTEEHQCLERVHATIESFRSEGGMNPQAAAVLNAALEGFRIRLGLNVSTPSTESFGSHSERMAMTEISIESIGEKMNKIWGWIREQFNRLIDWVKEFFGKKKESAAKLKERFKVLKDADAPKGKPGKEDGMEYSKTKDVFYAAALIEGPAEAIKFANFNASFGLNILEMTKKLKEAINAAGKAAKEASQAEPDASTASSEAYTISVEKKKNKKANNGKVAKAQEDVTKAVEAAVAPVVNASGGDVPSNPPPKEEGTAEQKVSPYFFGGKYIVFEKGEGDADFSVDLKGPEKIEGKDGKLAFSSDWAPVKQSAEICYKYLDDYTASKAAEDLNSSLDAMTKLGGNVENKEAMDFIRDMLNGCQKLVSDLLGKVDTVVLSGMGTVADYYEATKDSYKED